MEPLWRPREKTRLSPVEQGGKAIGRAEPAVFYMEKCGTSFTPPGVPKGAGVKLKYGIPAWARDKHRVSSLLHHFPGHEICQSADTGAREGFSEDRGSAIKHIRVLMKNQSLQWLSWGCSLALCWHCEAGKRGGDGRLPGCKHWDCCMGLLWTAGLHNENL